MNCELEAGNEVWVIQYNGPTCCIFEQYFQDAKKCLVLFHDAPILADEADCFATREHCYRVAAEQEQAKALEAMKLVQEYLGCANVEEKSNP